MNTKKIHRYLTIIFIVLFFCCSSEFYRADLLIIAHRGGVVDSLHSENSIKALEEAIRRGYTHVEVDARITADGHVVCFHDEQLMEDTGIRGKISELPVDSVFGVPAEHDEQRGLIGVSPPQEVVGGVLCHLVADTLVPHYHKRPRLPVAR